MADQKISELTNITGANLADADEFVVVDTSADQTKAVTRAEFFKNTPPIDVTGTVTADGLTVDGEVSVVKSSGYNQIHLGGDRTDSARAGRIMKNWDSPYEMRIRSTSSVGDTPIYFDTGSTNTRMTIDSSGNVGIGMTPSYPLHVSGHAGVTGSTYVGSTFSAATPDYSFLADSSLGMFRLPNVLGFSVAGSERMRIDSSGHAIIPAGVTLGTAAGVYSAANTLDDYEEGTWTPRLDGSTTGTATYVNQTGYYTKIGNRVFIQGRVRISSLGTIAGTLAVDDLPFTNSSAADSFSPIHVGTAAGLAITAGYSLTGYTNTNSTQFNIRVWDLTTGASTITSTEFSADGDIIFSGSYPVA